MTYSSRCRDSLPSRAGHPTRAMRAPGVRAGWRAAPPGRAPASGPSSRAAAVAPPPRDLEEPIERQDDARHFLAWRFDDVKAE